MEWCDTAIHRDGFYDFQSFRSPSWIWTSRKDWAKDSIDHGAARYTKWLPVGEGSQRVEEWCGSVIHNPDWTTCCPNPLFIDQPNNFMFSIFWKTNCARVHIPNVHSGALLQFYFDYRWSIWNRNLRGRLFSTNILIKKDCEHGMTQCGKDIFHLSDTLELSRYEMKLCAHDNGMYATPEMSIYTSIKL